MKKVITYVLVLILLILLVPLQDVAAIKPDLKSQGKTSLGLAGIPTKTKQTRDKDGNLVVSKTVSEYDIIKFIKSMSDIQLPKANLPMNEINEIKRIKAMPLGSKEGYGDVKYDIKYSKFKYKYKKKKKKKVVKKTYITTTMTWSWSKTPVIKLTDLPSMVIGSSFKARTYSKGKNKGKVIGSAHANFYRFGNKNSSNPQYKKRVEKRNIKISNDANGAYIHCNIWAFDGPKREDYYALGGAMKVAWVANGKKTIIPIRSNYGHKVLSGDVSVTFGSSGASITYAPKTRIMCGDNAYICVNK